MEEPTTWAVLAEHWAEILVAFLVFLKGVLNIIPTQQPVVLFSFLDWLIDYLVPNRISKAAKNKPKA